MRAVGWVEPKDFFVAHVAGRARSFWLDGSGARSWSGRWSYVGWLESDDVSLTWHAATSTVTEYHSDAHTKVGGDIFEQLAAYTERLRTPAADAGWVGFFGYAARPDLPAQLDADPAALDGCWLRVERYVAFDHDRREVFASCRPSQDSAAWHDLLQRMLAATPTAPAPPDPLSEPAARAATVVSTLGPERFAAVFEQVQRQLRLGNSYETNLTFRTTVRSAGNPVDVYRRLRRLSPAPYAALLTHNGTRVLSSSPERFAKVGADGVMETRPIKGTTSRDPDPVKDAAAATRLRDEPKFVGENLMIVDLLRNDLSRVCEVGSVEVTDLMHVESYPAVHQLVTTIRGRLREDVSTLRALHALFPGGSMTGAPKLRTMAIIANVESTPRGVYAGALGWIRDDGSADLGITIRTLVYREGTYVYGTGGGITVESVCDEEYAEAAWKAHSLLASLGVHPPG